MGRAASRSTFPRTPRSSSRATGPPRRIRSSALRRARSDRPVAGPPLARPRPAPGQRVAISVCDITRPQPRPLQLAAIARCWTGSSAPRTSSCSSPRARIVRARRPSGSRCSDPRCSPAGGSSTTTRGDAASLADRRDGRRRARVALNREWLTGRPPDHHGLRRAALLRRLQRRPEDGRARPGRPRDGARAPQRGADRRPAGRPGASRSATRSTTPSGRSRPRPASTSRSTC